MPESAAPSSDALFVMSTLGIGGSETKIVRLCTELADAGRSVGLAYLSGPHDLLGRIPEHVAVSCLERRGKFSPGAVRRLAALIRKRRPRTVFAVDLYSALYIWCACLVGGWQPARRVALVNTTTFVRTRDKIFMFFYGRLLRRFDEIVFGCERQRDEWLRQYALPAGHASVIYNGVDTARFAPTDGGLRGSFGWNPSTVVIGNVARLWPEKAQRLLIEAMPALLGRGLDVALLIVGEGPKRPELEARIAALGLGERVRLPGARSDVRALLATMDVFALPSTSVETFSNAALEAMAMQLPLVLSDIGGAAEMIREGVEGYLVPPGDLRALEKGLERLCADAALRARMGAAARARARHCFSLEAMREAYVRRLAATG